MPTLDQIRAARALLNWSQTDLADRAGLSQTGIARIESGVNQPNTSTLEKIEHAFAEAGIEFIADRGVEKRIREVRTYNGTQGFRDFMDDVYNTVLDQGGPIALFNARPALWYKWLGEDWYKMHSKRMRDIKDKFTFRATVQEGETLFIAKDFGEYHWFPKEKFNERAFYCYGDKLAFISFEQDDVEILVLKKEEFADGFRVLFDIAWDYVSIRPHD